MTMNRQLSRRQLVQGAGAMGLGLLAGCSRWPGQPAPTRTAWRLGWLHTASAPWFYLGDVLGGLQDWGYIEGQNLTIEYRYADYQNDRLPTLAAELVQLPVDTIVTHGTPATQAVHQTATTIPIVFMAVSDPVGQGFVTSLAQPGANLTGTADFGVALSAKRLEILKETVVSSAPIAVLRDLANPASALEWRATQEAANALGVSLQLLEVRVADDLPSAFDHAKTSQCAALLVLTTGLAVSQLPLITSLAASTHLPVMYFQRAQPAGGGLMAYGPRYSDLYRRTGYYVDRILKGAKPADLPVEQPTTFDFVINLQTAQALGLTIPHHVLLQATEVIQ
jgi:putative tryptophan/tyrosine transport system substrate-binding protein